MEKQSALVKVIGNYKIFLKEKEITLETDKFSASLKFSSLTDTCRKFIEINSEEDVKSVFDLDVLTALDLQSEEKQEGEWWCVTEGKAVSTEQSSACQFKGHNVQWLPKPKMRKEAAEVQDILQQDSSVARDTEKKLAQAVSEWLTAQGIQGTEEDIEKHAASYLKTKAPNLTEDLVERISREAYANWKASQPVPSEVGQEGKGGMGVANMDGTGTFVEPNRGNTNVMNESPTNTVRKEATDLAKKDIAYFHEKIDHHKKVIDGLKSDLEKAKAKNDKDLIDVLNKQISDNTEDVHAMEKEVAERKSLQKGASTEEELCSQCDQGAHERCTKGNCACGVCKQRLKKEAEMPHCKRCTKPETSYRPLNENGLCEACRAVTKEAAAPTPHHRDMMAKPCVKCNHALKYHALGPCTALDQKTEKPCGCAEWALSKTAEIRSTATLEIIARIVKREDGWHVMSEKGKHLGGPYKSRAAAKKRLQQVEMFKHMKGGSQGENKMIFSSGETAVLNTRVGQLNEGTEVTIIEASGDDVTFEAGDILGLTKSSNLDKVTLQHQEGLTKEAAAETLEKYQWDNDGLKHKLELGDRVKIGSIEQEGQNLKGKEGTIRDKVIMTFADDREMFYLVEVDGSGCNITLPEEVLSKAGKANYQAWPNVENWKEAALSEKELTKESVLKPNFDVVQEFLESYDNPPTVVTTADIEKYLDEKNLRYTRKDLKEIVKYLQSARVEVRVPTKRPLAQEETIEERQEEPIGGTTLEKEAATYRMTKPDGTVVTEEKPEWDAQEITEEVPGKPPVKWTKAALETEASCTKCSGLGEFPCECIESENLWLSSSICNKCNDRGVIICPCRQ